MNIQEKLTKIAEDMPKVYEAGVAEGKKTAYDEFWDAYQQNGNRENYGNAFAGVGWNAQTFRPKYDIKPINAGSMFHTCYAEVDLVERLNECGVTLDFSECTNLQMAFQGARCSRIGIVDARKTTSLSQTFAYSGYIETIEKVICNESTPFASTTFGSDYNLKKLIIEGTIGVAFDVKGCLRLNKDSHISIVNALSTTKSGLTATFSKQAVNKAFETGEGKADGSTSSEWLALVATKPNWTISLS